MRCGFGWSLVVYLLGALVVWWRWGVGGCAEKSVGSALFLTWFGVLSSVLLWVVCPPRVLALPVEVPAGGVLPFSRSAALRVEAVLPIFAGAGWIVDVVWVVALCCVLGLVVWMIVQGRRDQDRIVADAQERYRVSVLEGEALGGFYRRDDDPMAAVVLPRNPQRVSVNVAHAPGRRYVGVVVVGGVVFFIVSVCLALW